ncbi:MAG: GNAT family N-acetyltransferase [Bdellovibrionota bacterium]
MDSIIRNLNEEDFHEYYRIRLKSLEENPVAYSSMPKFFRECPKEKHLSLLKDSGGNSRFFVKGYFEENCLLGIIVMLPESRECVDHKASMWGDVDSNYQGRGIGTRLLSSFLDDARAEKCLEVSVLWLLLHVSAIHLFKKFGFEEYGREHESIRDLDNKYYDQLYLQIPCI